ncbi:undecaprenyl diphosphate synthase [SAR116 cluster alpha proteobacterium HIMB100]|nr:undecaprenyl diphosphate synthase [SAR116 cluster alpha proteobacterium HIMB100]
MALTHLAIIMDGNRRWARQHTLRALAGHDKGAQNLKDIARAVAEHGVTYLTVFAFSSENWKRSQAEVSGLISLMRGFLQNDVQQLIDDNIRLLIIGDRSAFDDDLQALFAAAEQKTSSCTRLTLTIALNYGGRQDILNAAQAVLQDQHAGVTLEQHDFEMKLNTRQLPDVDLLVRTGGERRLSNFLLWEMSYAELYFTDVLWPDFTTQDLSSAIKDYYSRDRRYGGDPVPIAGDVEAGKRA